MLSRRAKVLMLNEEGAEVILAVIGVCEIFGEMGRNGIPVRPAYDAGAKVIRVSVGFRRLSGTSSSEWVSSLGW
jgi:hypothetical protein